MYCTVHMKLVLTLRLYLQTHAIENAESAEIKECRAEETGVGGTTGREETEASTEGPRYTVWYVFRRFNFFFL